MSTHTQALHNYISLFWYNHINYMFKVNHKAYLFTLRLAYFQFEANIELYVIAFKGNNGL